LFLSYSSQLFTYQAAAHDPDGGVPLTFDVPVHPAGLAVGAQSGLVTWQPTPEQAGTTANVLLRVTDTQGSVALQWFQITVLLDTQQAPVITSVPGGNAYPNVAYQYLIVAQDGDGDPLTYALINNPDGSQPPSGMTLSGNTISWTPAQTFSVYTVLATVQVSDGQPGRQSHPELDHPGHRRGGQPPAHDDLNTACGGRGGPAGGEGDSACCFARTRGNCLLTPCRPTQKTPCRNGGRVRGYRENAPVRGTWYQLRGAQRLR
jgi:hypothetical protein